MAKGQLDLRARISLQKEIPQHKVPVQFTFALYDSLHSTSSSFVSLFANAISWTNHFLKISYQQASQMRSFSSCIYIYISHPYRLLINL